MGRWFGRDCRLRSYSVRCSHRRLSLPEHYEKEKKGYGGNISAAITNSIWAEIKFIDKEDASNPQDDFATEIMDDMNIDYQDRQYFWLMFAEEARKRLVKKRANVVSSIRLAANKGELMTWTVLICTYVMDSNKVMRTCYRNDNIVSTRCCKQVCR